VGKAEGNDYQRQLLLFTKENVACPQGPGGEASPKDLIDKALAAGAHLKRGDAAQLLLKVFGSGDDLQLGRQASAVRKVVDLYRRRIEISSSLKPRVHTPRRGWPLMGPCGHRRAAFQSAHRTTAFPRCQRRPELGASMELTAA
jgi:hypothetical protein